MKSRTIDLGIDLGTTNSVAAVMVDGEPEVVNSDWDVPLTPSCVAVNERGELEVGRGAVNVLRTDDMNAADGFKRFMGTSKTWFFPRSGESYGPTQLSKMILQSLKRNVETFLNEEIDAAVITIPAVFGERERTATLMAATEAGFDYAELVQEPIAAGLAYGWNVSDDDRPFLIYDIGGGTFDAALLQIVNGQLIVRSHRGDQGLGGRNIDAAIVDRVIAPALRDRVDPSEISRKNRELLWRSEDPKIRLSQLDSVKLALEGCVNDLSGRPCTDVLPISRKDLDPLIDAVTLRTIKVVEELLAEVGVLASDLRGIVLVGGPTRSPRLRAVLTERFGDILQTRVDPMTVVARGAALHAASLIRRPSANVAAKTPDGLRTLRVEYTPVTDRPSVTVGISGGAGRLEEGLSVRLTRTDGLWQTGLIPIKEGRVVTQVTVANQRRSCFTIELFDATGARLGTDPSEFHIISGLAAAAPPLSVSIGVSVSTPYGPKFMPFANRGDALPITKRMQFRTTQVVRAGDPESALEVYFLEGNSEKPQRCANLGTIKLTGEMIQKPLPADSVVEITLKIANSEPARATIDVPLLEWTLNKVFEIAQPPLPTAAELRQNLLTEGATAARLTAAGATLPNELASINRDVDVDLAKAANGDEEAAVRAGHALTRLGQMLEAIETKERSKLARFDLRETEGWVDKTVSSYGDVSQQASFDALQARARKAEVSEDARSIRAVQDDMIDLGRAVYWSQTGAWIAKFQELVADAKFVDSTQALSLTNEGRRALESGDVEMLRRVVIQLWNLSEHRDQDSPEARFMWLRPS